MYLDQGLHSHNFFSVYIMLIILSTESTSCSGTTSVVSIVIFPTIGYTMLGGESLSFFYMGVNTRYTLLQGHTIM